jgi:UDP-4-amino-4,6-dideoxy-N-acetyl-beta-L-altrosamine transaminase
MIPYAKQSITQEDIDTVIQVLGSDFLTQGEMVPAFEQAVADRVGALFGTATNSATSALHIALLALDVGQGDHVWTSPITFVATSNAALYCGATVDFVDIDPDTFNLSMEVLVEKLDRARDEGKLPKVVIPVHMGGSPCDMSTLARLADEYGFRIIEDASHAIGGRFGDGMIGNGRFSDITVFSFHPVKIITTGEGGMTVTNNESLDHKMKMLRSHGITSDPKLMVPMPAELIFNYQQQQLGFNYRMTELQAALGLSQLNRLDAFITERNRQASDYRQAFSDLPVQFQQVAESDSSSYHLFIVRLSNCNEQRHRAVYDLMYTKDVMVNLHYIPVYLQPYYRGLGFQPGHCPEAELYYREALTLPLFPDLKHEEWQHVVEAFKTSLEETA